MTNPPSPKDWRALVNRAGSVKQAGELIFVASRTVRSWVSGERVGPMAAAELLDRKLQEQGK